MPEQYWAARRQAAIGASGRSSTISFSDVIFINYFGNMRTGAREARHARRIRTDAERMPASLRFHDCHAGRSGEATFNANCLFTEFVINSVACAQMKFPRKSCRAPEGAFMRVRSPLSLHSRETFRQALRELWHTDEFAKAANAALSRFGIASRCSPYDYATFSPFWWGHGAADNNMPSASLI